MEVSGQLHAPGALHPGKPKCPTNRGWVGPIASLDVSEKRENILPLLEFEPRTVQLEALSL
jgi:hypothetical protein